MHILSTKLNALIMKEWQTSVLDANVISLKQITDFLIHKSQTLEAVSKRLSSVALANIIPKSNNFKSTITHVATAKKNACDVPHFIFQCSKFLSLSPDQRNDLAKSHKLCLNCLRTSNQQMKDCMSLSCKSCNKRHNSL